MRYFGRITKNNGLNNNGKEKTEKKKMKKRPYLNKSQKIDKTVIAEIFTIWVFQS